MLIRLLIDHPYIGPKGTVIERSEKDARAMIGNRLAEPADQTSEVQNKKLKRSNVKSGTLRATEEASL